MPAAESTIVFLPRFTTLVPSANPYSFSAQPVDVSQFASAQFQVWRGPSPWTVPTKMLVFLEESLDYAEQRIMRSPGGASSPSAEGVRCCDY